MAGAVRRGRDFWAERMKQGQKAEASEWRAVIEGRDVEQRGAEVESWKTAQVKGLSFKLE